MALSSDASFETIVLPHLDAAYNFAHWLARDSGVAEGVVQEAIVRALTYSSGTRGMNTRGWLLQIVRDTAYDVIGAHRGTQLLSIEASGVDEDWASENDDPETSLIGDRDRARVRHLIKALPFELREVLVLRELEGLSYKDIADVTRSSIDTVMSRLWRARRQFARAAVEQQGAERG